MLELTEKRTLHSKTHDLGNSQYRLTASMIPMHYEENGQLLDIDMTIRDGIVNSGLYKVRLLTDKIGFEAIDRGSGKKIKVYLGRIGNQDVAYSTPTIEGNKANWLNVKPGTNIEFVFNNHQVNIFRILQNAQSDKTVEWNIEDEVGDKNIKMNDKVRGKDAARNETKHTVLITPPENQPNRKLYTIRDTFESKVYRRNPFTRVREEIEPEYPIKIDPTITITISNDLDDGDSFYRDLPSPQTGFTISSTYATVQYFANPNTISPTNRKSTKAFLRFPGITIPQSATINTATLEPWILYTGQGLIGNVRAKNLNNPAAPTNFSQAFNPGTLNTVIVNKTFTTAAASRGSINVQTIVQSLVNSFDYSNEAMLFFISPNTNQANTSIGIEEVFAAGGHAAQLVIDYTVGGGGTTFIPRLMTLGCG